MSRIVSEQLRETTVILGPSAYFKGRLLSVLRRGFSAFRPADLVIEELPHLDVPGQKVGSMVRINNGLFHLLLNIYIYT